VISADMLTIAREYPIERVITARSIKLRGKVERVGPCPRCGGHDRFSINVRKGVFYCRRCDIGGDVIALVQFLDGVSFREACSTLSERVQGGAARPVVRRQDDSRARPTPQTTIEAIMYCVKTQGVGALTEPANTERLLRCDAAAKAEINRRIAKFIAAKVAEIVS
jgi:phage/plasmid primase-like uncharacterized protein